MTKRIETTVGRAIFNLALPAELGKYYNETMDRKQLRKVVADCYRVFKEPSDTAKVVNEIKKVGFEYSTRGGMSIAVDDVVDVRRRRPRSSATRTSEAEQDRAPVPARSGDRARAVARARSDLERRPRRAVQGRRRGLRGQNSRLHDGGLWREGKHEPDQPDGRYARTGARSERSRSSTFRSAPTSARA